jgi:ATP-dependent DNA ligase
MTLPFEPPLEPMLAKVADEIPDKGGYLFEPKWDGFRALVFRDGDDVYVQSRDKRPFVRYFPELVAPLAKSLPERCILDGEIIMVGADGALDFEGLQQRIHPAKSRIDMLAKKTPTAYVAFDLLALGDDDLRERSMRERRAMLERVLEKAEAPVFITPATEDIAVARDWFTRFEGAGLDGIIAKPFELTYQPKRRAMVKIKHQRTADCVVAGFRWHKKGKNELIGSLLLGLYDDEGKLHHAGITSSFTMKERRDLALELEPLRENAAENHPWAEWANWAMRAAEEGARMPGGLSRWSQGKDLSWEPLRIERVCEVKYDWLQGNRFRHATTFLRWRHDKEPADCRYRDLDSGPASFDLRTVFG